MKNLDWRVKSILIALAITFAIWAMLALATVARGQEVVRRGNTFVERVDSLKRGKMYSTNYTFKDKDGNVYPIYLSSGGNAFIVKVSKKSGRQYRKYLPEVTKKIAAMCGKPDKMPIEPSPGTK